jgi:undecaprenyl phosphate-alpha-L-ara4N flippase subunit ArnF
LKTAPGKYVYVALAGASIVLTAAGQLGMKAGMRALADLDTPPGLENVLFTQVTLWTAAGLCCYCLSMLAWLTVLSRYPLSLMYPLLSLSYVLVYLGATHWSMLMEPASMTRSVGTVLIALGVAMVSMSGRPTSSLEERKT